MTEQPSSEDADVALSFLLRVQEEPEDDAVQKELQQWREADLTHERAWQAILRVRMIGRLALQARTQREMTGPVIPFPSARPHAPPRRPRWRTLAIAAAASIAAVVSMPQGRLWLQADYRTGTAESRHIMLADGSEAILGASSALAVHIDGAHRHIVLLQGEALFRVRHDPDRDFVVQAGSVTSRDIGTVFDVRKGGGHVVLAVAEGSIGVTPPQATRSGIGREMPELRLHAGEQIDIMEDNEEIRHSTVSADSIGSWDRGIFGTNAASVNDMLSLLERYYPGYVFVHGRIPAGKLVGGVYDLGHPTESIRMLATSSGGSVSEFSGHVLMVRFPR